MTTRRKTERPRARPGAARTHKKITPSPNPSMPDQERLLQLFRAVEQSPVSVVITNIDGIIEYVNPQFCKVTGYTPAEVLGNNPRILKSGEMPLNGYKQMWQTLTAGKEWHGEFHNRKKNGELFWESATISPIIDTRGKITHYIAIKEDITERKRIEGALRTSEHYAQSIIQSSLDIVIAVDNQRRITEFNPAAEKAFGYTRAEVIGKHIGMLYADTRESLTVHQAIFHDGKLIQEVWNRRKNGQVFPSYLSAAVMRNEHGDLVGVVGMSRDITEAKRAEESLVRRDATLSAVAFAAEQFLRSESWEKSLPQVMERIGQAARVSRVYLFENYFDAQQNLHWKMRVQWTAPNIKSRFARAQQRGFRVSEAGLVRWQDILGKGELIQGHVRNFPENEKALLLREKIQSLILVPIFTKQSWWGFIGFDDCAAEREWSAQEADALVAAADTLGAAIDRERVDLELQARMHHLGLLNEITHSSIASSDLREMLYFISNRLEKLLEAQGCSILLWNEKENRAIPMATTGLFHDPALAATLPQSQETYAAIVGTTGQALSIDDMAMHAPSSGAALIQALLVFPLIESGRPIGAALIGFDQPRRFTPSDLERGAQASDQIALAIAKAQLFASEQQRAAELEALWQASLSLTSSLDLAAVLNAILESTMELMPGAKDSHIYLYAEERLKFGTSHFKDGRKGVEWAVPRKDGLTYTVAQSGEAIVVSDMRRHPLFVNTPPDWEGAIVGLPLKIGERVVGVMVIAFETTHVFPESELRALRLLGTQAAIAIENARLYDQVQQLAVTDDLTGLFNRRGFNQIGAIEFDRAWRFDRPLAAFMLDVDHFKQTNDTFGHAIGDKVLSELAEVCRRSLRTVDVIGRYGGEEFVILLPEADIDIATRIAERLRGAVEKMSVPIDGVNPHVTISVGVATMTSETPTLDALIERADQAQYRAKQAGRNRVIVYER